tara:strand:+ start:1109 stop:2146 length:1038 start_codon:yes stop_codon:yes gene_type:complete
MDYNLLPGTEIKVSKICLGTMTFGRQNNEKDGHDQMDYSYDRGVNFFDTAELYPVPPSPETQGETERIIGSWLDKTGKRDKIILASKVAGPSNFSKHIRENMSYSKATINEAINNSLTRLRTDYIDLYQIHWPERVTNFFGKRGYKFYEEDPWKYNFDLILDVLDENIKKGKIRNIGISNETPWGLMKYLIESKENRPKIISIQNPYSLLNRTFEIGNSEICHKENIGLLAYSPLGFGTLTGKYLGGNMPKNARLTLFPHYDRFSNKESKKVIQKYFDLAKEYGMSLTTMALSFVNDRSFVTSNIIGATSIEQLKENIDSYKTFLSDELLEKINIIHNNQPNPAP